MRRSCLIICVLAPTNVVLSAACGDEDEAGAAFAGREMIDPGALDEAAVRHAGESEAPVTSEAEDVEASARIRPEASPGPGELVQPGAEVFGPPGKCCYARCGAQVTYQKVPWAVEGSCDQEGWNFCELFYVAKLVDAAWLPC